MVTLGSISMPRGPEGSSLWLAAGTCHTGDLWLTVPWCHPWVTSSLAATSNARASSSPGSWTWACQLARHTRAEIEVSPQCVAYSTVVTQLCGASPELQCLPRVLGDLASARTGGILGLAFCLLVAMGPSTGHRHTGLVPLAVHCLLPERQEWFAD